MPLEQLLERYQGHGKPKDLLSPVVASKVDKTALGDTDSGEGRSAGDQGGAGEQADADPQVKLNFDKLLNGHSDNENNENIEREIRVRQQQQGGSSEEDDSGAGSSQQSSTLLPASSSAVIVSMSLVCCVCHIQAFVAATEKLYRNKFSAGMFGPFTYFFYPKPVFTINC